MNNKADCLTYDLKVAWALTVTGLGILRSIIFKEARQGLLSPEKDVRSSVKAWRQWWMRVEAEAAGSRADKLHVSKIL